MSRVLSLALFAMLLTAAPTHAAEWKLRDGSAFTFEASFEGSPAPGRFEQFELELAFDPVNAADGQLRVTVNLAAADMGDPDMNGIIADPFWFDVVSFPRAVFASERIEASAPGEFTATGILTLKGMTQTVTVPFQWSQNDARASMRGEFVLQRIDFNVGSGEWSTGDAIGIDVKLQFDLLLERDE
jgi:polyisoprenoid-binding protein YceI